MDKVQCVTPLTSSIVPKSGKTGTVSNRIAQIV